MQAKYEVVAIMPIKLNNERLPGKNTMLLGGLPLLQYELNSLAKLKAIDKIFVYCSSSQVCEYLPKGCSYLNRPEYLDLPSSNFTQIFSKFMESVDSKIYIYAHATAPFVTIETMQECLDAVKSGKYDSAFCATKIQDYLWQNGRPLNFDAQNIPRSQDIQPIYRETSGVYVFTKEVFVKHQRRIGFNPYIKEVTYKEAVDINTREDFKLAEALIKLDL